MKTSLYEISFFPSHYVGPKLWSWFCFCFTVYREISCKRGAKQAKFETQAYCYAAMYYMSRRQSIELPTQFLPLPKLSPNYVLCILGGFFVSSKSFPIVLPIFYGCSTFRNTGKKIINKFNDYVTPEITLQMSHL